MALSLNWFLWFLLAIDLILFSIGVILNVTVLHANKGLMPVHSDGSFLESQSDRHFYYKNRSEVKYWFLTDFIRIRFKHNVLSVSIGDIFIYLGEFFLLILMGYSLAYTLIRPT